MGENEAARTAAGSVALAAQSGVNSVLGLVLSCVPCKFSVAKTEMGVYASLLRQ